MTDNLKIVEDWYFPEAEKSVFGKMKSIREAKGQFVPIDDYQVELRDLAIQHSKKHRGVIDIGAHIGIWSVAFSKVFKKVYAFEINPDTLPCLYKNIESKGITNVDIFPYGLGEEERNVSLCPTSFKSMATFIKPGEPGNIPIKKLDSLNLNKIDLIKLDIEGYESLALMGAIETIKRNRPVIIMEDRENLYEKYNVKTSSSEILKEIGMKEIIRFKKDVLFGW